MKHDDIIEDLPSHYKVKHEHEIPTKMAPEMQSIGQEDLER